MSFTMIVGNKRFCAKTIDRIVENFCRWRDSTVNGSKPVGTHWSVRTRGKVCGDITYNGTYWPKDSPERPPWIIVEELFAKKSLSRAMGKSQEYKAGLRAALEWQYMRSPLECCTVWTVLQRSSAWNWKRNWTSSACWQGQREKKIATGNSSDGAASTFVRTGNTS